MEPPTVPPGWKLLPEGTLRTISVSDWWRSRSAGPAWTIRSGDGAEIDVQDARILGPSKTVVMGRSARVVTDSAILVRS